MRENYRCIGKDREDFDINMSKYNYRIVQESISLQMLYLLQANYIFKDCLYVKDNNAKVCFLTASELYYEEFRKKEYCALDRNLFIQKPIDNEDLVKEINKMIKKQEYILCA
jgi:hypothetical protein